MTKPDRTATSGPGRDGFPSRPKGVECSAVSNEKSTPKGRLGEPSLPDRLGEPLPVRKQMGHVPPPHANTGAIFFVTINCQQRGKNQLCFAETAKVLLDAVRFYHNAGKWFASLLVVMPDHVHGLFGFPMEQGLQEIVSSWKRFTARKTKIEWQRDFFDHRLRQEESYAEKANYIRQNPVRKGLIARAEDWPYVIENDPW